MAIRYSPGGSAYASAGEAFGTGLGSGINSLLEEKLGSMLEKNYHATQTSRTAQALRALNPSLSHEQAYGIAQAPQSTLKAIFERGFEPTSLPEYRAEVQDMTSGTAGTADVLPPKVVPSSRLAGLRLNPSDAERRHTETLGLKKEIAGKKEKSEAFKHTAPIVKDILAKENQARIDINSINRLEELNKSGKLDTPGYIEFLKNSGLDIPALMNPESEEFQKIIYNFAKNAKQIFGARVSNFEFDQFLKSIPSLSQSPEGRKRVMANLKNLNRADIERGKALREIVKENNGVPPLDLELQIEDRLNKKLDGLAKLFRDDLQKEVPEGQNKYITALQSAAGKTLGNLPKAAAIGGGALSGARLGSSLGGRAGGVAGGILGGLTGGRLF